MRLSAIDRKILNCIQKDIPFESEPFKLLSKRLGIEEDMLLKKIRALKGMGVIRNFSAGIDHKKLGFTSSLIALKVRSRDVEDIAKKIVPYPEVTHCFLREGKYNLWVVFICLNKKKVIEFLNKFTKLLGADSVLNLPTKRKFKLKTTLTL